MYVSNYVDPSQVIAYVEGRGFKAERIFNTTAIRLDGAPVQAVGLRLSGPRGNQSVLSYDKGLVSLDMARLWCDGVDYSTARIAKKRAFRKPNAA